MENKLIVKHPNIPLRGYPEAKLKEVLENVFTVWISNLLGLTGEVSAKRLYLALPAIEKHFLSKSFDEIQKTFIRYADGELSIKPIPNYFDRILVGQIFKADQEQQRTKIEKKPEPVLEISDSEKEFNEILSACICFDHYKQHGFLNDSSMYLYKVLIDKKLLKFLPEEKQELIEKAQESEELTLKEQRVLYKKLALIKYFDRLIRLKRHIKDFL